MLAGWVGMARSQPARNARTHKTMTQLRPLILHFRDNATDGQTLIIPAIVPYVIRQRTVVLYVTVLRNNFLPLHPPCPDARLLETVCPSVRSREEDMVSFFPPLFPFFLPISFSECECACVLLLWILLGGGQSPLGRSKGPSFPTSSSSVSIDRDNKAKNIRARGRQLLSGDLFSGDERKKSGERIPIWQRLCPSVRTCVSS